MLNGSHVVLRSTSVIEHQIMRPLDQTTGMKITKPNQTQISILPWSSNELRPTHNYTPHSRFLHFYANQPGLHLQGDLSLITKEENQELAKHDEKEVGDGPTACERIYGPLLSAAS